ncbi:MAG: prepilin-type N-terminal cleavage/methylation domain-containing protein, partial [Gallionella sp.]
MELSCDQAKEIKQNADIFECEERQVGLSGSRLDDNQQGFTLIELIMVMVIVGVMAVFAAPRFFDANIFKSRGFADQVQATLRYAQKEAIAQHRNVCVGITASTITLKIANTSGAGVACGPNLNLPAGGS